MLSYTRHMREIHSFSKRLSSGAISPLQVSHTGWTEELVVSFPLVHLYLSSNCHFIAPYNSHMPFQSSWPKSAFTERCFRQLTHRFSLGCTWSLSCHVSKSNLPTVLPSPPALSHCSTSVNIGEQCADATEGMPHCSV